jgi:hypothetical protein
LTLALALGCAAIAPASAAGAIPIPEGPDAATLPVFLGAPAKPHAVQGTDVPQNPFMAPNGRSNLHDDAYMTDSYEESGPLGHALQRTSTFLARECASTAFDARGRLVTVCVGLDGPQLQLIDPRTLDTLAVFPLPPRLPSGGNPFTDFSGGGYFYLDNRDRAVIPTTTGHIWVVSESGDGFALDRDYDVTSAVPLGDKIESALPDWSGRIWFVSAKGVVGYVDPESGAVRAVDTGEAIGNSFATDETGGVYVVSDAALYRFAAPAGDGPPTVTWRSAYPNDGTSKPGQTEVGSGTTPTITGPYVAITDNADPIDIVVYRRAGGGLVCTQPLFTKGQSDTDQSLVAAGNALVAENNYGYSGPTATENGGSTAPGLERVDIAGDGSGCRTVWHSDERAPSVVPKVSLAAGLVYTYTKEPRSDGKDAWYFTALDFRSGRIVFKRLAGEGLGFNNNYAPVTLGPDGTAYVGVLGGLVALRDG